ncbi:hypothetical protein BKH42_05815 [Helicobacter sp. 13S00482-2]|uniref:pimelyl-ACP methyl ester esterase BioV n=1 Tax=Helicobacter sp. 13S00482-2 TaxID=1476200 RepID=UPI000BA67CDB|nr:pimelyl-ACP methyl ester esterase BioV [Helicobacter sp. 13S00482-2]PAF53439.1 hypothetical protein BKH42_05815 [Helicobacter sp. 13S00482-2]
MHFSGFCFQGEEDLFSRFSHKSTYDVSGFSYGAQKACEEVVNRLNKSHRVHKLILYSPAFFQDKTEAYKRLQLSLFKKNKETYMQNFLKQIGINEENKRYFKEGNFNDLEDLLSYNWDADKLEFIVKKGVCIEVFLGECDEIIDAEIAKDFFASVAIVYFIRGANHCLINDTYHKNKKLNL